MKKQKPVECTDCGRAILGKLGRKILDATLDIPDVGKVWVRYLGFVCGNCGKHLRDPDVHLLLVPGGRYEEDDRKT